MTTTPTLRPATVSAVLKKAGITTVAPSDRNREGVKVTKGHSDRRVTVTVDINVEAIALRRAAMIREVLEDLGYVVEVNPYTASIVTVTKN